MSARITKDNFFLLTLGMPLISNGIAFAIESVDVAIVDDLTAFIFLNDDASLYQISKLVKKRIETFDVWCRVKMLTEKDYEIAESTQPRNRVSVSNINFLEELACSPRSFEDIQEHKAVTIVGFKKNEKGVFSPYIISENHKETISYDNSSKIVNDIIERCCK